LRGAAQAGYVSIGIPQEVAYGPADRMLARNLAGLGLAGALALLAAYHYATKERERKKIEGAFMHYVAPVVIEAMLKDPAQLKLGGDEKVLTVLFSDLQGFTAASERYTPHEMIELLSEYYARMTEQIFAYQGMLKEYVGDELLAIFGAPLEQPDHAVRACAAALAMRAHRNVLREEWTRLGRPPLITRTGINSGRMLVGNLGSEYRFAYGVLGDHVNLGSRLEGLNKVYGTEILLGENTAQLIDKSFLVREIDLVRVVGREQAVRIYELLGRSDTTLPEAQEKAFSCYAAGLEAYRQRFWDEALELFRQALTRWPEDGPARIMVGRCQGYQTAPPPEEWEGVFEALDK
jgi:adenylate cyclase